MIDQKTRLEIQKRVDKIRMSDSGATRSDYSKRIAIVHQALMIFEDMSGPYCVDDQGQVFSVSWDDISSKRIERDPRVVNVVLSQGAKIFPELESLTPFRGANDLTCPSCGGSGIVDVAGIDVDSIVCYCGGLGWIPAEKTT